MYPYPDESDLPSTKAMKETIVEFYGIKKTLWDLVQEARKEEVKEIIQKRRFR